MQKYTYLYMYICNQQDHACTALPLEVQVKQSLINNKIINLTYFVFYNWQVTSSNTLTVREGGPQGEVRIQATVPPSLFCLAAGRESDCTVAVKASVESLERNPPTCSQGRIATGFYVHPSSVLDIQWSHLHFRDWCIFSLKFQTSLNILEANLMFLSSHSYKLRSCILYPLFIYVIKGV